VSAASDEPDIVERRLRLYASGHANSRLVIMTGFRLARELEAVTVPVNRLPLSDLRLMDDARFPWLLLVPRRPETVEIIDLAPADRLLLLDEIALVSRGLKAATACDKLNIAAIGNVVPQLHVHVVARYRSDAAWPGPVWGTGPAVAYAPAERDKLLTRLHAALSSPTA
jgi:diadenosine tetraphosphate (Ap4A) HIT family hydrolase